MTRRLQVVLVVLSLVLGVVATGVLAASPALANPKNVGAKCADVDEPALPEDQLPGRDGRTSATPPANPHTYYYDFPEYRVDLSEPTPAEMAVTVKAPDQYTKDSRQRLIARWIRYQRPRQAALDKWTAAHPNGGPGKPILKSYADWLKQAYPSWKNDAQGTAYEEFLRKLFRLGGNYKWTCDDTIPGGDPKRFYDFVNHDLKLAYEVKSGDDQI
jgi:hypothetical protein